MMTLRPVSEWLALLDDGDGPLTARLKRVHPDVPYFADVIAMYRAVLGRFGERFAFDRPVGLVRAPGRVNLLGMHVDHRGGAVNPIAVRGTALVVAPRDDDRVVLADVNRALFPDGGFSISGEMPDGPIADWEAWTRQALRDRAGDDPKSKWLNYFRAAVLYLEHHRRHTRPDAPPIRGMDVCVGSTLPRAAGLSSSSALVVAAMLATIALNDLPIDREEMVDMCGEAEWFVGTRGGQGDHAAILFGEADAITHVAFWPLDVSSAPLPHGVGVVLANSLKEAQKQAGARDTFNARVTGYVIGDLLLKRLFPEHADRLHRLRDVNPAILGVNEAAIYRMLRALPVRASRADLRDLLPGDEEQQRLHAMFETHAEPADGYAVRQVTLYAVSECLRSEMAPGLLRAGDVAGFGALMNLSHEGDRVTRLENGRRVPVDHTLDDAACDRLIAACEAGGPDAETAALWRQPGGYDCSCVELDEIVDIARAQPGVMGAGLVGAGLGGAVAILAEHDAIEPLTAALTNRYYAPRSLTPAIELCTPVEGAGVLDV